MGYNTTILILNDAMGDMQENPKEFVDNLLLAVGEHRHDQRNDFAIGNHVNGGSVLAMSHADTINVIAVGGNYGTVLDQYYNPTAAHHTYEGKVMILKLLAEELGYKVTPTTKGIPNRE